MYINYMKYLLTHKFWVTYYCFKDGIYRRGIMHDIDKFRLSMITGYAPQFYNSNGSKRNVRDKSGYYDASQMELPCFVYSWLYHQRRNKHHWQYWAMIEDSGNIRCLDMPSEYVREMICDWRGAGRAQGTNPDGGNAELIRYYNKNKSKMYLSDNTRKTLERLIGYDTYLP